MIRGPLPNPATSELDSPGLFLMAFSRLNSVAGSSVSDVAGGPRFISVDIFEKFCISDQNKKIFRPRPTLDLGNFDVLV